MYEITKGLDGKFYCRFSGPQVSAAWRENLLPVAVNMMIHRAKRWNDAVITRKDIVFTKEVLLSKVVIEKRRWNV